MKNHHHTGPGPSQRQLRVGEVIRRALAEIFAHGDLHEPDLEGVSLTVGEVRASPDLKVATVYVLPLGGRGTDEVMKTLNRVRGAVRREVARRVQLKYAPELRFVEDTLYDRLDATREMFADPAVKRDLDGG